MIHDNRTLTANEIEFLSLCRSADMDEKAFIFEALACTVAFGKTFLNEVKDIKDREGIINTVAKYTALLKANT